MANKRTLVLEGGGMRGVFTAGVLDFFLDEGIDFDDCIGVSAGVCHGSSFVSRQRGRALEVSVDYLHDKNYCGTYSLVTSGDLFNVKMVYDTIPNGLNLFDYDAFVQNPTRLISVLTDCKTGEAVYYPVDDMRQDIIAVRASSSLPMVSRMVEIGGVKYLDGGVADPIPVRHALSQGAGKCVVVLTQHPGYIKGKNSGMALIRARYARWPKLVEAIATRHHLYNETLAFLEEEQKKGAVFVIQPQQPAGIDRIEKDPAKLRALYQRGYDQAKAQKEALIAYLNQPS